jgi:hypothetical protein
MPSIPLQERGLLHINFYLFCQIIEMVINLIGRTAFVRAQPSTLTKAQVLTMKKLMKMKALRRYGIWVGALASTLTVLHYTMLYGPSLWVWGIDKIPQIITTTAIFFKF